MALLGIIGGTGLGEALHALEGEAAEVSTPFGSPSGPIHLTRVGEVDVALLARHGPGHLLNPSQVPYRANIFALKTLGVTRIIASGAVGSLREEISPGQLVIPDQLIDRTFRRAGTFFDDLAVHVELASPFCSVLRHILIERGPTSSTRVHEHGTYLCMEGPQLSTRAESELHRAWGAHLIGMTAMPEAKLAREAEICYALVALATDYDCWKPQPAHGDKHGLLAEIIGNFKAATQSALQLIQSAVPAAGALSSSGCDCQSALELAIWSDKEKIPGPVRDRLRPLLRKYVD